MEQEDPAGARRHDSTTEAIFISTFLRCPLLNCTEGMVEQTPPSFEGDPYVWDTSQDLPAEGVRTLWTEVANGLEKSQTGKFSGVIVP